MEVRPELARLLAELGLARHATLLALRPGCSRMSAWGFRVGDASWITFSISELDLRARRRARASSSAR